MDGIEELDRRGRQLLAELEADPRSDCWRQFDNLFYEPVFKYLRAKQPLLGARVARYLGGAGNLAPEILPEEIGEVLHDATQTALRRVRENAWKFVPERGSPTQWVLGAAEFAYVDVAKAIVEARRSAKLTFVDPSELLDHVDAKSTEEHVLRLLEDADALADAASHLEPEEWTALRLRVTAHHSRLETALLMFRDETAVRRVDRLVESAKRKLAVAWIDRKPSPGWAGSTTFTGPTDDKEEADG